MQPRCLNDVHFSGQRLAGVAANQPDTAYKQSYLAARGFSPEGMRCGGILSPQQVHIAPRTVLIRLFGGGGQWNGQWWFTPYEMSLVVQAMGHENFGEGRGEGKGVLHASLAVLAKEWNSSLEYFCVIETREAFKAFYGPGDHALIGSREGRKAVLILDPLTHVQRAVRQVFLPKFWQYEKGVDILLKKTATDADLRNCLKRYSRGPMQFEL